MNNFYKIKLQMSQSIEKLTFPEINLSFTILKGLKKFLTKFEKYSVVKILKAAEIAYWAGKGVGGLGDRLFL